MKQEGLCSWGFLLHHSIYVATSLLAERQAYWKWQQMIFTAFFMSDSKDAFQGLSGHLKHKRKCSAHSL